jgi:hypothetical protein
MLNVPHSPALEQIAVQSTPREFGSEATFAVRVVDAPEVNEAGGAEGIVTTMGAAVTIFAVAVAESKGLMVDRAVIAAVPPGGITEGAE